MAETTKLVDWILSLERKYPVETWKVNDVHMWPVIRNSLNISLFYHFNSIPKEARTNDNKPFYEKLSNVFMSLGKLLLLFVKPLRKSDVLFSGANSHRDYFEGKWVNKFFDPLVMRGSSLKDSYIVEYQENKENSPAEYYRSASVIRLSEYAGALSIIRKLLELKSPRVSLPGHAEFVKELEQKQVPLKGCTRKEIVSKYFEIEKYSFFYRLLINKIKPKRTIGLCYYSNPIYGMNLASYRNGITSVDIQHGGQGPLHLAYCQYLKLPEGGEYNVVPHSFWCWDQFSLMEIQKWITALHGKHTAFVGGHPWLELHKQSSRIRSDLPIVLLTMQPYGEFLDGYIIDTIRLLHGKVKWILRLHPRQVGEEHKLEQLVRESDILEDVVNDQFKNNSLPEALAASSLHLTKSSGSVIEASLMGIPNVILDSLGAELYADWVKTGKAVLCLNSSNKELSSTIINSLKTGSFGKAS